MKTLKYFINKYYFSKTETGKKSTIIKCEKELTLNNYQRFLIWIDCFEKYILSNNKENYLDFVKNKLGETDFNYFIENITKYQK